MYYRIRTLSKYSKLVNDVIGDVTDVRYLFSACDEQIALSGIYWGGQSLHY